MTNNQQQTTNKARPTERHQSFGRGFTIVESLVAIVILILAITGATSVVQTSLSSYILSKDQIIAFYLAQEGVEQIRNIRDENGLKNQDWLTGLLNCLAPSACYIDVILNSAPVSCDSPGNCPALRQDTTTGFYGYNSSWPATTFKREITLSTINANEVSILVTVNWSKGLINRQFRARENILNWQ